MSASSSSSSSASAASAAVPSASSSSSKLDVLDIYLWYRLRVLADHRKGVASSASSADPLAPIITGAVASVHATQTDLLNRIMQSSIVKNSQKARLVVEMSVSSRLVVVEVSPVPAKCFVTDLETQKTVHFDRSNLNIRDEKERCLADGIAQSCRHLCYWSNFCFLAEAVCSERLAELAPDKHKTDQALLELVRKDMHLAKLKRGFARCQTLLEKAFALT